MAAGISVQASLEMRGLSRHRASCGRHLGGRSIDQTFPLSKERFCKATHGNSPTIKFIRRSIDTLKFRVYYRRYKMTRTFLEVPLFSKRWAERKTRSLARYWKGQEGKKRLGIGGDFHDLII